jgi:tripartite-type tricarboxylate transporter receptor subunit TctC
MDYNNLTRRRVVTSLSALGASSLAQQTAFAQSSDKPIRFILPVSAGSGVDGIVRAASQALSKALGQTVVIENQPGAGGVIGTQAMIRSQPDGQTLSVVSNNHVPAKDMKELVALLKANPGKYNYGSSGNGTILHLAAELFKEATLTFATHIPYRGFGSMLTDLAGGQVDFGIGALPAMQGQIKAGNVRAICVSAPARIPAAPEIMTAVEQGYPKYLVEGWFAVIGPKGMAPDTVKKIQSAFSEAFATPEVKAAMARQGNTINVGSSDAAAPFFRTEMARYAATVKRAGVVPE